MRVRKLKLVGFSGVRAGQGRDEIELDFEELAGDAALVAIAGPNGAGKTTIMDNLTPYRLMPSRAGSLTPEGFSYYDNMSGSTALKELEWEYEGNRYRTSIVLKMTGRTRKQEAFLHVWKDGVWVPAEVDGIKSDGKTDTYDTLVVGLLGEPEVFCASQFRSQNARSLAAYTNGEIKTLMSGMLRLDSIRNLGLRAGQVAKLLKAGLDTLRNTLGALTALEDGLPDLEARSKTAQSAAQEAEKRHQAAQEALIQAQAALTSAQSEAAAQAGVEAHRKQLQAQMQDAKTRAATAINSVVRDHQEAQNRLQRARDQLASETSQTLSERQRIEAEGKKQQGLLDRRDEIAAAVIELGQLRAQEQELTAKAESERTLSDQIQQLRHRKTTLQNALQGLARERDGQCRHRDTLAQQAGLVQDVPCRDTPLQGTCPLLREAVQAGKAVGTIEIALQKLDTQSSEQKIEAQKIDVELATLEAQATRGAAQALAQVSAKIRQVEPVASLSGALEVAESALQSARAQWESLKKAAQGRRNAIQTEIEGTEQVLLELGERKTAIEADWRNQETLLQSEIAGLPETSGAAAVAAAEASVAKARKDLLQCGSELETAHKAAAGRQATVDSARAEISAGAQTRERAVRIETEIGYWSLLAKALGNDGIIALSIDDAGPELSQLTNELLASCYGPRFTISIQTQVRTAKGELREGFEILVHDAADGTSTPIARKSGGEQVWLNEAITRAIALYLARTSGRQYRTLFSDEADGALDLAHKRQFMAMKRRVLELGGYEQEFFVSQTPELWAMADTVIDLGAIT
ncbi:MAG: hypothetical protein ACYDHY_09490 [Acidiferrobacterales bacterium]